MPAALIEQALLVRRGHAEVEVRARSPGLADDWRAAAQRLCLEFGDRPDNVACPAGVFALPLARRHVAVVQVTDRARPGLAFHLLALPRSAYRALGGDPFELAGHFPPTWDARGELPALPYPGDLPRARTVAEVQRVLQRPDGPLLLGAAQALVDGSRLVLRRPAPDEDLLRALWTLLPTSTRADIWPASFAFGNALAFDVLVVPSALTLTAAGYLDEQQAEHYPEGRYELGLQIAAEAGDQAEVDRLFARRSGSEMARLILTILGAAVLLTAAMHFLEPTAPPPAAKPPNTARERP